jgi:ABC-2 type transport system ATP-binding protein
MDKILEIENLTKFYETGFWRKKKVCALDGLSLSVNEGQIFGFLGGNGAGKTTTIKILMRLLFATSGTAKIFGTEIANIEMHRQIGYCPENPYFYDYLTPVELLDYFGRLFGMSSAKRKERSSELLSRAGLEEKDWNKQLRKFSKGMLQRVGIAQSLINDPKVVFMDEPMSGLDPMGRRDIRDLIANLREDGTTVFMSTHILSDVEALCDEVAILKRGKLAATGKLDDLLAAQTGGNAFDVVVRDTTVELLKGSMNGLRAEAIRKNEQVVVLQVSDEVDIDAAIAATRKAGGKIVSVEPVRRSLEDYFAD